MGNPYTPPPHLTERLVFRVLPKNDYGAESSSSIIQHATFAVKASTTSEDVGGHLKGESVDLQVVKRHEVALRTSVQPENIWYGGAVRGESAMKVMPDIGSKVTHTFQISNDGPWHVGDENLDLLIDWPFQLRAPSLDGEDDFDSDNEDDSESDPHSERPGKWLLYLASEAEVSPPDAATCFLNPRMINHLGLRDRAGAGVSLPKRRRRRRESSSDGEDGESVSSSLPLDDGVTVNCVNGRARCMVLNCRLWHLRAGENVVIR